MLKISDNPARWACHADRLFDGEHVRREQAVIVEDGLVSALAPVAEIPRNIPVLAMPGCTILPGLIDTHVHFMRWEGPLYLAYGVTTIRDVGNRLEWILQRRAEAARHPWPRICCTGPALDGPVPHWPEIALGCADAEDAAHRIRELAAAGVDGIKLYVRVPPDWLPGMVATAHAAGLPVMMHCISAGALTAGRVGVDEYFHLDGLLDDLWPDHPGGWLEMWGHEDFPKTWKRQQQVCDALATSGMIATPTLTVWELFCRSRFREMPLPADAPYIPPRLLQWFLPAQADPAAGAQWTRAIENAQRFVGLLIERGVPILPGTDVPWSLYTPGHTLWRELALLVGCGMSPLETLRAATSRAASVLRADKLGRLAPGYQADLVVVEGDPTQAIPARPIVRTVVRAGQMYNPSDLFTLTAQYAALFDEEPMTIAFHQQFGEKPM